MIYFALYFTLHPVTDEYKEVLSALLDQNEFEGICEDQEKLIAYIPKNNFSLQKVESVSELMQEMGCSIQWTSEDIPEQNWNALWESNFEPVVIDNRCVVRAKFHDEFSEIKYRITIDPKMSFGTGHHQTTRMMLEKLLEIDIKGKIILDMGCGTGVLAILTSMRGASQVFAIDNDKWAVDNSIENINNNKINNIEVIMGGKDTIPEKPFDIILANINRNILLDQMSTYSKAIAKNGLLLVSGILIEDIEIMTEKAREEGFHLSDSNSLNNWSLLMFKKN